MVKLSFIFIKIIFEMSYYYPYSRVLETESALRRSRLAAEIAASRVATEAALRRSRIEA